MSDAALMNQLRQQIAQTVAQRDALKKALDEGAMGPREGLRQLEVMDARLSQLDSQFKALWDQAHAPSERPGTART